MLHFFIDTKVLLSFYSFTQDDLTRLEQLAAQVEAGTFVVLTTPQVEDEFHRNREVCRWWPGRTRTRMRAFDFWRSVGATTHHRQGEARLAAAW